MSEQNNSQVFGECCKGHDYVHDNSETDSSDGKKIKVDESKLKIPKADDIRIEFTNFNPDPAESAAYIAYVKSKYGNELKSVEFTAVKEEDGSDFIDIKVSLKQPKVNRIRRITGYLVGTTDRFNNAKRAEEHDRVKHMTSEMLKQRTLSCTCESCSGN